MVLSSNLRRCLLVFASRRPFSTIGYNQRIASIIQATWDDPAEQRPPCAQPHDGITDGRDFPLITRHQFVIILLTSGLVTVFSVSLSLSMSNRNTATSDRLFSMLLIPVQYKGSSTRGPVQREQGAEHLCGISSGSAGDSHRYAYQKPYWESALIALYCACENKAFAGCKYAVRLRCRLTGYVVDDAVVVTDPSGSTTVWRKAVAEKEVLDASDRKYTHTI
jgi:hypothetical protein